MLRRLFLALSLVFLFGFGQQGAAVHAISHLNDEQGKSQQDKQSRHGSFCDKCAVFAALDSAVGTDQISFGLPAGIQVLFIESGSHRSSTHTHHYAARAPPFLV